MNRYFSALVLMAFFCASHILPAQDLNTFFSSQLNGAVEAMTLDEANQIVYVSGSFTKAGNLGKNGVIYDPMTGEVKEGMPFPNGAVLASCPDGNGGLYIGGSFTQIGDSVRHSLAHLDADGKVTAWGRKLAFDADVLALALHENKLYVGGNFQGAETTATPYVAPFNQGELVDGFPVLNARVNAAVSDGRGGWYIGGDFTKVGTLARTSLAHVDKNGHLTDFMDDVTLDGTVNSLALEGDVLYVGGGFRNVALPNAVSNTGTVEFLQDGSINPKFPKTYGDSYSSSGNIDTMVPDNEGGWYIGGSFRRVEGTNGVFSRNGTAHINARGEVTGWTLSVNGGVRSIVVTENVIYVHGNFTSVGGRWGCFFSSCGRYLDGVARTNFAATDKNGTLLDWTISSTGAVSRMISDGERLLLAGSFTQINGVDRPYLAAVDFAGVLTNWEPQINNGISQFYLHNNKIYIAGGFTQVNGIDRIGLARLNLDGTLDDWNPILNDGTVTSMHLEDNLIYLGGTFSAINGQSRGRLALVDEAGTLLDWAPASSASPLAMGKVGEVVYVGLPHVNAQINGQPRSGVAAIDGQGQLLPLSFTFNGQVFTMSSAYGRLIVSGGFNSIGILTRNALAAFHVKTNELLPWNPSVNGLPYSIKPTPEGVYVVGSFTSVNGGYDSQGYWFGNSRTYAALFNNTLGQVTNVNFGFNSTVSDLEITDDKLVFGGWFTSAGGQTRNRLAVFDRTTRVLLDENPNADASIQDVELWGDHWYLAGDFTSIGGQPRNKLARLNADFTLDEWQPSANQVVNRLVVNDDRIWAIGNFTTIDGQPSARVASFDPQGTLHPWPNLTNGQIAALSFSEDKMLLAGNFLSTSKRPANFLTRIDVASAQYESTPMPDAAVNGLHVQNNRLYVVGNFTRMGGLERARLASVDLTDMSVTPWNPSPNSIVSSLGFSGNQVFVGGYFTSIGGQSRLYLAAVDSDQGAASSWAPSLNSVVSTLLVDGDRLYIGGSFATINSQTRWYLASFDIPSGNLTDFNPNPNGSVSLMWMNGGNLQIFGGFSAVQVNPVARANFAEINPATGLATNFVLPSPQTIRTIRGLGSQLYIGGGFSNYGGKSRAQLAAFDLNTATLLDWNPNPGGGRATSLILDGDVVYLGGYFTSMGGQPRNYLAAVDRTTGALTNWNPQASNHVNNMAKRGDVIYVGGSITTLGGQTRNALGAVSASSGAVTTWNPNVSGVVYDVEIVGDKLYAGGSFTLVSGLERRSFAEFDLTNHTLTDLNPINGNIYDFHSFGDILYVGGDFASFGGIGRRGVAAFHTVTREVTEWHPLLSHSSGFQVRNLWPQEDRVYLLGSFTRIGQESVLEWEPIAVEATSGVRLPWYSGTVQSVSNRPLIIRPFGNKMLLGGFTMVSPAGGTSPLVVVDTFLDQTLRFEGIQEVAYGDNSEVLQVSASSGLPVQVVSSDEQVATFQNGELQILKVGETVLTATQAGNADYAPAQRSLTMFVQPRTVTVLPEALSKTYGDMDPTFTYSTLEGGLVGSDVLVGSLIREPGENVGDYAILAGSLSGGDNYQISVAPTDFQIEPRAITVRADALSKAYGDEDPALGYAITAGNLVNGDQLTGELARQPGEELGEYAIEQNTLQATANYAITYQSEFLTIEPRPVSVLPDALSKTYGEPDEPLTFEIVSGSLIAPDEFSGELQREPGEEVGQYAISQNTLALSSNYSLEVLPANYEIVPRILEIQANDAEKTYGEPDPSFSYVQLGGELINGDELSGEIGRQPGEDAGNYAIVQNTLTAGNNYSITFETGTFTIGKATLQATADDQTIDQRSPFPTFTISYDGFVNGDDAADLDVAPVASVDIPNTNTEGVFVIHVSGGQDNNYDFEYVSGQLTINFVLSAVFTHEVSVYPNPFSDHLTIDTQRVLDVVIVDIHGKVVFEGKSDANLNVHGWAPGMYMLQLENEHHEKVTFKLLKR